MYNQVASSVIILFIVYFIIYSFFLVTINSNVNVNVRTLKTSNTEIKTSQLFRKIGINIHNNYKVQEKSVCCNTVSSVFRIMSFIFIFYNECKYCRVTIQGCVLFVVKMLFFHNILLTIISKNNNNIYFCIIYYIRIYSKAENWQLCVKNKKRFIVKSLKTKSV